MPQVIRRQLVVRLERRHSTILPTRASLFFIWIETVHIVIFVFIFVITIIVIRFIISIIIIITGVNNNIIINIIMIMIFITDLLLNITYFYSILSTHVADYR
jgi:hypothetical protein